MVSSRTFLLVPLQPLHAVFALLLDCSAYLENFCPQSTSEHLWDRCWISKFLPSDGSKYWTYTHTLYYRLYLLVKKWIQYLYLCIHAIIIRLPLTYWGNLNATVYIFTCYNCDCFDRSFWLFRPVIMTVSTSNIFFIFFVFFVILCQYITLYQPFLIIFLFWPVFDQKMPLFGPFCHLGVIFQKSGSVSVLTL